MSGEWAGLAIVLAIPVALVAAGVCFRVSAWHQQESDYWRRIHVLSLVDKTGTDEKYLPVLRWVQANRPSIFGRLKPWVDPEQRMEAQR